MLILYQFEKHISQLGPDIVAFYFVHPSFAEHVQCYASVYIEILRKGRHVILRI